MWAKLELEDGLWPVGHKLSSLLYPLQDFLHSYILSLLDQQARIEKCTPNKNPQEAQVTQIGLVLVQLVRAKPPALAWHIIQGFCWRMSTKGYISVAKEQEQGRTMVLSYWILPGCTWLANPWDMECRRRHADGLTQEMLLVQGFSSSPSARGSRPNLTGWPIKSGWSLCYNLAKRSEGDPVILSP